MNDAMKGRRILIVGGAAGIGLATARLCIEAGAKVAVLDRNPWIDDSATPIFWSRTDVRLTKEVEAGIGAAAKALDAFDGLIYCAGIDQLASLAETRDEDWTRILDVNLTGAMRTCRSALPYFSADGGTMVLVASAAGLRPLADRSAYCASKAALVMFAKSLALELAARGIRVNALCPGAVETALFRSSFEGTAEPEAVREIIKDRYALRRIAEPEEMARSIVFLSSAASSYVTGVALAADGGRSFH